MTTKIAGLFWIKQVYLFKVQFLKEEDKKFNLEKDLKLWDVDKLKVFFGF